MNELPKGWVEALLRDVTAASRHAMAIGPFGSNLKVSDYADSGVPLVFVRNIRWRDFGGPDRKFITTEKALALAAHTVQRGDVLVTKMGEPPGDTAVYDHQDTAVITADCIKVTPHAEVSSAFLAYMIQSPPFRDRIRAITSGVAQQKVSLARFAQLPVPLPPAREQLRIVDAIEEQFSRLEDAEHSVRSAKQRLRQWRTAVLVGAIDGEWPQVELGDVLKTLRNGLFVSRPASEPPGIPIYRISAVRPLELDVDDIRYADVDATRAEPFFVEAGDLLFTRYSGNPHYVGSCAVVPRAARPTLHPDKLIRGVVDPAVALPSFVALSVNIGDGRAEIEKRLKTTAGQVGIAGSQLKSVVIRVPPVEVQRRIIEQVDAALTTVRALGDALDRATRRSEALRRAILTEAFSGRLVPQNPSDEPASELLARIAAERPAASKPQQRKRA